jgi:hypothetical protein
MSKRPTKPPQDRSWSVYQLRGTPAKFIGLVYAPDEATAIQKAIEEFKIAPGATWPEGARLLERVLPALRPPRSRLRRRSLKPCPFPRAKAVSN